MNQSARRAQITPASTIFPDLEPANGGSIARDFTPRRKLALLNRFGNARAAAVGDIKITTLSFRNQHERGTLLTKYMEARKSIFIDRLNWNVSEADGMEFDQYDTPACRWVVLHEFGEVLGGVRLLPTTASCGCYSYMLRDAQRGLLQDLPTDILFFEAPVNQKVWEATRFFVTDKVPAVRRAAIQHALFNGMTTAAKEAGASQILGIVSAVWARWARRLNVKATPTGAKFPVDGGYSQSVLFNINKSAS